MAMNDITRGGLIGGFVLLVLYFVTVVTAPDEAPAIAAPSPQEVAAAPAPAPVETVTVAAEFADEEDTGDLSAPMDTAQPMGDAGGDDWAEPPVE